MTLILSDVNLTFIFACLSLLVALPAAIPAIIHDFLELSSIVTILYDLDVAAEKKLVIGFIKSHKAFRGKWTFIVFASY